MTKSKKRTGKETKGAKPVQPTPAPATPPEPEYGPPLDVKRFHALAAEMKWILEEAERPKKNGESEGTFAVDIGGKVEFMPPTRESMEMIMQFVHTLHGMGEDLIGCVATARLDAIRDGRLKTGDTQAIAREPHDDTKAKWVRATSPDAAKLRVGLPADCCPEPGGFGEIGVIIAISSKSLDTVTMEDWNGKIHTCSAEHLEVPRRGSLSDRAVAGYQEVLELSLIDSLKPIQNEEWIEAHDPKAATIRVGMTVAVEPIGAGELFYGPIIGVSEQVPGAYLHAGNDGCIRACVLEMIKYMPQRGSYADRSVTGYVEQESSAPAVVPEGKGKTPKLAA